MESNNSQSEKKEYEEVSIVEILLYYLRYWKSFLISIVTCLVLAFAYLLYTTPEYNVTSKVLINDDKKGQTADMSLAFSDLGIVSPQSTFDNEIEVLRSQTLLKNVVDSLRINISYFKGKLKKYEIYKNTPVYASISNIMADGSFTVDSVSENILSVHSNAGDFDQKVEIGKDINSPWGILKFTHNPFGTEYYPIEVFINSLYLPEIDIVPSSKTASVVDLSFVTPVPGKGQDIINTLIAIYNKNAIDDKNYTAYNTISFIDNRLQTVSGELETAEKNVEDYQKAKGITNIQAQGQLLLTSSSDYSDKITGAGIQLELLKSIQTYLMNPANKDNAVPSNLGLTDQTVISLINAYNNEILLKKTSTVGMQGNHPMLIEYNNQVAAMRDDLLKGIGISEAGIQSTIQELVRKENMYAGKAIDLNTQARESRDLLRQQSIKETIFTYLLQKREDTGLSLAMATPNAKVIDAAYFDPIPVKPKKIIILLAAFFLSVIIPVIVIYIRDLFDNKIHTKDDITKIIKAPFLGVIPVMKSTDPFPVLKVRSSMAERFRTIISNLEFVVGGEKRKIISITSFTSGDGKSFFSRNLAMSLATSGKKTLLVDLDLRKSTLVKTLGMTNTGKGSAIFLADKKITINEIIDTSHKFHKNLDIIPVYLFPPNPAELLSSERLEQLFHSVEKDYDYIVVDTAPVGLVSDILYINAYSAATIFLLRSDYTLRKFLPEIQELYEEKRLNNLNVVLNAVKDKNAYGYGYGQGSYKHNYYTEED